MKKYVFVSGGVISGVGKGIAAASIGFILKSYGLKVTAMKCDPYVNVDAGTMNPLEHGETFVLEDGLETDMDLGHYERYMDVVLTKENYMTTGSVYQGLIQKERNLEFGGKCVQVVPHVPEEIISRIEKAQKFTEADVVVVEIGGTAGEYENILFLEANRTMKLKHPKDVAHVHVSYLPLPSALGEMKTKPTQISVRTLNAHGINPDFILARGPYPLDARRREKLSYFCSVPSGHVISAPDVKSIYEIPLNFEKEKFGEHLLKALNIKTRSRTPLFAEWEKQFNRLNKPKREAKVAIVGKYIKSGDFSLKDSYVSVSAALDHAAYQLGIKLNVEWIVADGLEKDFAAQNALKKMDAIIVPQGWGSRGVEGKIKAVQIARENKIPFLGLCFGMQMATIEFARNMLGWKDANTEEADPKSKHQVIHLMAEQKKYIERKLYGGTIRLGAWPCAISSQSNLHVQYKKFGNHLYPNPLLIAERHRHRYEFNNAYRKDFESRGFKLVGQSPDGMLVEAIELDSKVHPFFIATQYHPEYKSHFLSPHPLFVGLLSRAK